MLAQAGRQVGARRVDRRLHVARRAVDVAAEPELQGDAGRADRAREVISVTSAMTPRWRSSGVADGRRHRLGAGARHLREHRDRREIDLRQRRYRQLEEREQPGQRNADRQQRRRDRPPMNGADRLTGCRPPPRLRSPPKPAAHGAAEPVEAEIDDRRREQGQQLAQDQAADDRHPERMAQLRAGAAAEHQRQCAEHRRDRRHHDRPEAQQRGLVDRLARRLALVALRVEREVDDHDAVLLDDADQEDDADDRDDAEIAAVEHQRQQRADPGRRQGREDRDRVDVALVQHPQHDVDRDDRGDDQHQLVAERRLKGQRRALEAR